MTRSRGISIPSSAILDSAPTLALLWSFKDFTPLWTPFTYRRQTFLPCQPPVNLHLPPRSPAPASPGKGCCKCLASWDDHPLCASCRHMAPEPCLGIFVCPTCVDWSEEQRLQFNNCRTYHKKVPSSPPSDLGDLLVVNCAMDPIPIEPVTSPPPIPTDEFHPDHAGSAHPGIPARGPLHPAVFPYGFPLWREMGGHGSTSCFTTAGPAIHGHQHPLITVRQRTPATIPWLFPGLQGQ